MLKIIQKYRLLSIACRSTLCRYSLKMVCLSVLLLASLPTCYGARGLTYEKNLRERKGKFSKSNLHATDSQFKAIEEKEVLPSDSFKRLLRNRTQRHTSKVKTNRASCLLYQKTSYKQSDTYIAQQNSINNNKPSSEIEGNDSNQNAKNSRFKAIENKTVLSPDSFKRPLSSRTQRHTSKVKTNRAFCSLYPKTSYRQSDTYIAQQNNINNNKPSSEAESNDSHPDATNSQSRTTKEKPAKVFACFSSEWLSKEQTNSNAFGVKTSEEKQKSSNSKNKRTSLEGNGSHQDATDNQWYMGQPRFSNRLSTFSNRGTGIISYKQTGFYRKQAQVKEGRFLVPFIGLSIGVGIATCLFVVYKLIARIWAWCTDIQQPNRCTKQ